MPRVLLPTLLAWATLAAPALTAQAASDREAVRLAVLDYVEGFYDGDTVRLVRSVWPEVKKYGYSRPRPDAPYAGSAMPYRAFMSYANSIKSGRNKTPAGAPKDIVIYDVQDQTASAKLTAWWGTDYLLLAKESGRWMVTAVLWQSPPPKDPGQEAAMAASSAVDHVIIGIRSLDAGIKEFTDRTGVTPVRGGRHPGAGTENALVSLGNGVYLEIIAVVPGDTPARWASLLGMERLTAAGWAIQTKNAAAIVDRLKTAGVPHMGPTPGSRETPDGKLLTWQSAAVGGPGLEAAPFLIEWGAGTTHPSKSAPGGCVLTRMSLADPGHAKLNQYFTLVGLGFSAEPGSARGLSFTLTCPKGVVTFTG